MYSHTTCVHLLEQMPRKCSGCGVRAAEGHGGKVRAARAVCAPRQGHIRVVPDSGVVRIVKGVDLQGRVAEGCERPRARFVAADVATWRRDAGDIADAEPESPNSKQRQGSRP